MTVVGMTACAALWMYIDRVCFSTLEKPIRTTLLANPEQMSYALGAFFFSYAIFQVPAGAFADRLGPRLVLTLCIIGWSLATAATAFAGSFVALIAARLVLGVAEAGAYPAATGLLRNWVPAGERGRYSSVITLGGRLGGAAAPYLTGFLAVHLVGWGVLGFADGAAGNWRAVFFVFGSAGLAVAVLFWLLVRDHPAAQEITPGEKPLAARDVDVRLPATRFSLLADLVLVVRSPNMWLSGGTQFGMNFGWVFLVTLLPRYLTEVFAPPLQVLGRMQSAVLLAGCCGMVGGGLLTDRLRTLLGLRWGRRWPLGLTMLGCAGVCSLLPFLDHVWAAVAALAGMALLVDLGVPAIWAFNQDVGGRSAGAVCGWGNMWGNFGAALSPVLLTLVQRAAGWPAAFAACAAAFVYAAACALLLDASRPVNPADAPGA
jgi:MFS family permease